MRFASVVTILSAAILVNAVHAQESIPMNIAASVLGTLRYTEGALRAAADAMPEAKYALVPTAGNFKGARSFGEQIKHVACSNFGFFNEIEGKTPPPHSSMSATQWIAWRVPTRVPTRGLESR